MRLRTGTARAHLLFVLRKTALILAAIILPGGLIALFGSLLVRQLAKTERGRKIYEAARTRVPGWTSALKTPVFGARQAA